MLVVTGHVGVRLHPSLAASCQIIMQLALALSSCFDFVSQTTPRKYANSIDAMPGSRVISLQPPHLYVSLTHDGLLNSSPAITVCLTRGLMN